MLNTKKQSKPKLHRYFKAYIKQIKHTKQELKREENKDEARTFTSKQKFLNLILTVPLIQSSHNQTKIS